MNFLRKMLGGKAGDGHEELVPSPSPEAPSSPLAELEEQSEPLSGNAPSLATLFQQNAPLEATLPVLLGAAQEVARLHAGGWVHGKLCPEAIGTSGTVPLLDFSSVRRQGEVWEAPFFQGEYSAPELAQEGVAAQPNTDVYTLGVLFYQALAGVPMEAVQNDAALQQRVFAMAGVPQILTRALAVPESRFQNAGELHEALARWASRRTPPAQYSIAVASTIGLNPSRTANEDAALHLSGGWHGEDGQTRWALLAVADGMGGMDAGEVASQAAVRSLAQSASPLVTLDRAPEEEIQAQWTRQWAQQAAVAVSGAMAAENARGGCTLLAALAIGNRITLAHAGDCRAYVFSAAAGAWRVLTHDHSSVATLWQAGEIAWEELRTHPNRNQITRALGEKAPPPEWFFDSLETATGKVSHSLASREVLLLCSDGVWEPVLEEEMARLLQENYPDLNATAQAILGLALERGAPDNATVALLAVSGGEEGRETC